MKDHLAGYTEEQVKRLLDVLTGKTPVCPDCGGRLTQRENAESYCADPSCRWNQAEVKHD